ncbi:MAG: hypothetical protein NT118_05950, partial [Lentisphaerae bacterium]|nr:hypothetical protein [Lentisphaerota bacterium]
MKTVGRKSANDSENGNIDSVADAIADHVEKNDNCEFVRIMEQFSKMDAATMKKFLEYAQKLAE